MARCETCGSDDGKSFDVVIGHRSRTFDSFERAILPRAPACGRCGCRVIGHGQEQSGMVCCCAQHQAATALRDRP